MKAEQRVNSNDKDINQIVHINTFVQSSCKIRIGKRNFDTGAGKSVMSYSSYLLIENHLKATLHPNYIRVATANNTELINKGSTLITFKLGERMYKHSFIVVKQLSVAFLIGFDFTTLYKVGLY